MEITREIADGEFCLPSEFLAGDFFLGEGKGKGGDGVGLPGPWFFNESPDVFGFSPELAAEAESDVDCSAGLTRHMAHVFHLDGDKGAAPPFAAANHKDRAMAAASPVSTLYAMELLAASPKESRLIPARKPPPTSSAPAKGPTAGYYTNPTHIQRQLQAAKFPYLRQQQLLKQQKFSAALWGKQSRACGGGGGDGRGGQQMDLSPSAWPPPQGSALRAVFLTRGGTKRESAGTGVFLPRRPGTAFEPRKKQANSSTLCSSAACSPVLLPARVVQALNLNLEELNAQPRYPGGFVLDHDTLVGRSNADTKPHGHLRPQPQPATAKEIHLPQEWTY